MWKDYAFYQEQVFCDNPPEVFRKIADLIIKKRITSILSVYKKYKKYTRNA